jgi:hypothetical protein
VSRGVTSQVVLRLRPNRTGIEAVLTLLPDSHAASAANTLA